MTERNPGLLTATFGLVSLLLASALPGQQAAHVHGRARINVAIEEATVAIVELLAPGEAIYGFEHQPRDAEEREQLESGLEQLRSRLPTMLRFDPDRNCRLTVEKVVATSEGSEHDEHEGHDEVEGHGNHGGHGGHHSEVHAEVAVRCQKALAGSRLRFAVTDAYPELVELEVTLLSVERQSVQRIERDRGHVEL